MKAQKLLMNFNTCVPNEEQVSLSFSNGWASRFKARNRFKSYRSHGESADADLSAITAELPGL